MAGRELEAFISQRNRGLPMNRIKSAPSHSGQGTPSELVLISPTPVRGNRALRGPVQEPIQGPRSSHFKWAIILTSKKVL